MTHSCTVHHVALSIELWFPVLTMAVVCLDAMPVGNKTEDRDATLDATVGAKENELVFEGDIKISLETIRQFYDLNEAQENTLKSMIDGNTDENVSHVGIRAAISGTDKLWRWWRVPYTFTSSYERIKIVNEIHEWERLTCLRFIPRTSDSEDDYIEERLRVQFICWMTGWYADN